MPAPVPTAWAVALGEGESVTTWAEFAVELGELVRRLNEAPGGVQAFVRLDPDADCWYVNQAGEVLFQEAMKAVFGGRKRAPSWQASTNGLELKNAARRAR